MMHIVRVALVVLENKLSLKHLLCKLRVYIMVTLQFAEICQILPKIALTLG